MHSSALAVPDLFRHLQETRSPDPHVRIWLVNLDSCSPRDSLELAATLNTAERNRATQFHLERDRHRYVAARGLLRLLLGAALQQSASDLVFEHGAHGKPRLVAAHKDGRCLCFNLSHSDGHALFALAWNRELGIDIESVERIATKDGGEVDHLAARVLSQQELALWRALSDCASRRAAFFRAWVRKEAYVKATGRGLGVGLQSIDVMRAGEPEKIEWSDAIGRWLLHDVVALSGFVAALAVEQQRQ